MSHVHFNRIKPLFHIFVGIALYLSLFLPLFLSFTLARFYACLRCSRHINWNPYHRNHHRFILVHILKIRHGVCNRIYYSFVCFLDFFPWQLSSFPFRFPSPSFSLVLKFSTLICPHFSSPIYFSSFIRSFFFSKKKISSLPELAIACSTA